MPLPPLGHANGILASMVEDEESPRNDRVARKPS